ncbi:MAG TPA: type III-B CRISPR module-associated protein Cmr5 [Thermoanaerobaculia bacterium]|jgi:CRISPR/Cas system CMR-associated protein Cmr5 small subunit
MDLDQLRAHNAFAYVQNLGANRSDFLALARKLPFMLHTNGLLATWAHLLAKKKERENVLVLQALSAHLRAAASRLGLGIASTGDAWKIFEDWVDAQHGLTGLALRKSSAEALAFSIWLKRAAEALCDTGVETKETAP